MHPEAERKEMRSPIPCLIAALAALVLAGAARAADPVKIGIVKTLAVGPVFVAAERGYFADQGIAADLVYIDAAQPIAVAAASGAIDFGVTGLSAGFYALAAQGALRIIAAGNREMPGFKNAGYIASVRAYAAGLTSMKALDGHSVAVTQVGGMLDYDLALAIAKFGLDAKSIRVMPLQSNTNVSSAVAGGQVDAAVFPVTPAMLLLGKGAAKLLGWVGDLSPYGQANAAFTSSTMADTRRELVQRFLRAYRRGASDYHDAFAGPDETRRDGPTAPAILAILAKYTGQQAAQIEQAIPWVDAEARLDTADIARQIAYFHAQGQLKADLDPGNVIDRRYVVPLPQR